MTTRLEDSVNDRYLLDVADTPTQLQIGLSPARNSPPVEWRVSDDLIAYETALTEMDARVAAIIAGQAPELAWLLEHPPLYTAGTSAQDHELIDAAIGFETCSLHVFTPLCFRRCLLVMIAVGAMRPKPPACCWVR